MKDRSVPLGEFAADAHSMTVEEFARAHGSAFLVRFTTLNAPESLSGDDWLTKPTRVVHATTHVPTLGVNPGAHGSGYIYPLRQRHARADSLITVGRVAANDICIGDASLSKFHAHFDYDPASGFRLVDKNSTNGTWLGSERLRPGESYEVPSGKTVRFASVQLGFMMAPQFAEFARFVG